jgi:Fur family transcriptional regulator, peroxide stress response regulator
MSKTHNSRVVQDIERKMDAFQEQCRRTGLRVTPQRMAVYKTLLASKEHPSAEVVFRQVRKLFPSISLDTVNRTLLTLNGMRVAFVVEGSGDAKRFDANLETHQHFKCLRCRRIIDFHHEPFNKIDVPGKLRAKFTVLRKTVYLEGFCDRCKDSATG